MLRGVVCSLIVGSLRLGVERGSDVFRVEHRRRQVEVEERRQESSLRDLVVAYNITWSGMSERRDPISLNR